MDIILCKEGKPYLKNLIVVYSLGLQVLHIIFRGMPIAKEVHMKMNDIAKMCRYGFPG